MATAAAGRGEEGGERECGYSYVTLILARHQSRSTSKKFKPRSIFELYAHLAPPRTLFAFYSAARPARRTEYSTRRRYKNSLADSPVLGINALRSR